MKYNPKRVLAGILAAIMITSSGMPVLNAEAVAPTSTGPSGNTGGSGGLEGSLSDVFNVVVPTVPDFSAVQNNLYRQPFDFILDPKGLASSGTLSGKTLEPNATVFFENKESGSNYDYSSISDGFTVINKSTANVDVMLEASLTGMDVIQLTNNNLFVDNRSASAYLAMTDSKGKTAAIDKFGAVLKTTLKGQLDAYDVIYDGKYKYQLKSDAEIEANNIKFDNYTFRLTGACNSASSWSKLSGFLEPEIMVTWSVTFRPKNVAPSIPKTSYVMNAGNGLPIGVDLGSGTLAATDIKSIMYKDSSGILRTLSDNNYVFSDGILRFRATYISTVLADGVQQRDYVVAFNNSAGTQETITLVANDNMAPSIAETKYTMISGQPVLVDVDWGLGTLAASDIQSITFVNPNKVTKTVSTDNYSLVDGRLQFKDSFITALFNSGVTSRDYTITFNDKAGTQVTITLSADGTRPEIGTTVYTINKGDALEIEVDLGTGGLAATGIQEITFVNASGATKTVASENYVFEGDKLKFTDSYISALVELGISSRDYFITFNDAAKTQVKVTLNVPDVGPSIGTKQYTVVKGQPLSIDVNLGSGATGATGIQSITFVNLNKVTRTVSVDDYTLTNGVLEFKTSLITNFLSSGAVIRDYTITFNDKAKTQETVTLSVNGTAPEIGTTVYTVKKGEALEIATDLGTGDLAATGIEAITFVNASGTAKTVASGNYTFVGDKLTFPGSYITTLIDLGVSSRDYVITFNNVAKTQVKVTLKVPDVAPSIGTKQYTVTKGQPLSIDVNLGSGTTGATGIQSITFVNLNKVTKTVSVDDYTLANGVLEFKASLITNFLSSGAMIRDYIITFNDKAKTRETVTLSVNGTSPEIGTTVYTVKRGEALEIVTDLGTADLAATGIEAITFVNASGTVKTVASGNYTFVGNKLTFPGSYITTLVDLGVSSRDYVITFNNVAKTQVKVTLNVADVVPSIGTKQYMMVKGQPLLIDIDLGSGKTGATGISSISYMNSGKETIVPSSYYTVANGTLKLTASYINGVIGAGIETRQYKITFNDTARTQVTITLEK